MSFISRLGHRFSSDFYRNPVFLSPVASNPINRSWVCRNFSLPAKKEEEEEEEVEFDQRKLPADYDPANFDPTEHRSPPTDRVFRLVDEISGLTLVEITELSSILMKKLGMKEAPVVGVMKPGAAGLAGMAMKASTAAKEEKKVEKTVFELKLEAYEAASKIKVIKEVRSFTDLGLKEAKDLVEKTPTVIKKGVSKEEGEQIIEKMKALGAKGTSVHYSTVACMTRTIAGISADNTRTRAPISNRTITVQRPSATWQFGPRTNPTSQGNLCHFTSSFPFHFRSVSRSTMVTDDIFMSRYLDEMRTYWLRWDGHCSGKFQGDLGFLELDWSNGALLVKQSLSTKEWLETASSRADLRGFQNLSGHRERLELSPSSSHTDSTALW
ncbi:hypothetical protein HHK36_000644 [Tetracentron sinense]|uniref:Uncharacterized protein n=1 Tax=Tetracentron sinense TaxID=13715 RepID=A0A834ZSJ6_TETSI|nr:hypothetical protein HHK36_000644 [Tetracentron sinense]